jgi:hypothetical protein
LRALTQVQLVFVGLDAIVLEDEPHRDLRTGTCRGHAHFLAVEIFQALEVRALGQNQVHIFWIQVGDDAHLVLLVADELALTGIALGDTLSAREARIELTGVDGVHVGHRGVGGHGNRYQSVHAAASTLVAGTRAWRLGDGVGDQAADGVVGATGAAGADAEEFHLLGLNVAGEGRECHQDWGYKSEQLVRLLTRRGIELEFE